MVYERRLVIVSPKMDGILKWLPIFMQSHIDGDSMQGGLGFHSASRLGFCPPPPPLPCASVAPETHRFETNLTEFDYFEASGRAWLGGVVKATGWSRADGPSISHHDP